MLIFTESTSSSFLLGACSRQWSCLPRPCNGRAVIRHRSCKLLGESGCLDLMLKLGADQRPGPRDHVFQSIRPVSAPGEPCLHKFHDVGKRDPTITHAYPQHLPCPLSTNPFMRPDR